MSSAMMPPIMKNTNDVIRYIRPITLWSVLVIQRTTRLPGTTLTRSGRTLRTGSTTVTRGSLLAP